MPESPARQFFEAKVMRLMDKLYGTALRLTRRPADAEDLVADTIVRTTCGLRRTFIIRSVWERGLVKVGAGANYAQVKQ
jgi:DNA-directed RNA polymerase specialized sigma24 family protein